MVFRQTKSKITKMKKQTLFIIFIFFLFIQVYSQNNQNHKYLYRICDDNFNCGYLNEKGDTVILIGKYSICYTDTICSFGIVFKENYGYIGINQKDSILFKIFVFDNGPDPIIEDLFRIIDDNGNIGFANSSGEIVIFPQYKCAYPFFNKKAKVSFKCTQQYDGEYSSWESKNWFFIDKKGQIINE